jgi:tRNA nucleotidyltransferase (CCA-adding enzyme)
VKALGTDRPDVYVSVLRDCGALREVLPEVDALFGIPQPERWHPEIDSGVHTLLALREAARLSPAETVRFAVLTHDLGKATTPTELLPKHHGHEHRSLQLLANVCERLPVPNRFRELARHVAEHHGVVHRADELKPSTILKLITEVGGLRQPERFEEFLAACEADMRGRTGFQDRPYPQAERLRIALRAARDVSARKVQAELGVEGEELGKALYKERLAAIKAALPRLER